MSLRPRFGGEGRLRLPGRLVHSRENDIFIGGLGEATIDPFERGEDGLLLAESFARLDVRRPAAVRRWMLSHGVIGLEHFFPEERTQGGPLNPDWIGDALSEVRAQRDNVRWHLLSIARLSMGLGVDGAVEEVTWDAAWSGPILHGEDEHLWLGAPSDAEAHIPHGVSRYERPQDVPHVVLPGEEREEDEAATLQAEERWARLREIWGRLKADGVPEVWVPLGEWRRTWQGRSLVDADHPVVPGTELIETDRAGLFELERQLILPYIERASTPAVSIVLTGALEPMSSGGVARAIGPIQVRERRVWGSLLAPVYLQILEGLRRVSEGQRAAASCRECGEVFLTLDARRSAFCTDKERFRFTQRQRRKRLAASVEK